MRVLSELPDPRPSDAWGWLEPCRLLFAASSPCLARCPQRSAYVYGAPATNIYSCILRIPSTVSPQLPPPIRLLRLLPIAEILFHPRAMSCAMSLCRFLSPVGCLLSSRTHTAFRPPALRPPGSLLFLVLGRARGGVSGYILVTLSGCTGIRTFGLVCATFARPPFRLVVPARWRSRPRV